MFSLEVPDLVRQRALSGGDPGRRWLNDLPQVLEQLAHRWRLQIGSVFTGGSAALVIGVVEDTGRTGVLKVAIPPEIDIAGAFDCSVRAHQLANGQGCAELYAHDAAVPAMLLERLGPNLHQLDLGLEATLGAIVSALQDLWRPLDESCGLPTGADKALWLAEFITATWDQLGRPCESAVIERAITYCDERGSAFEPSTAVLVHGDAHGWNIVAAGPGRYKLVDAEGLWSEPAHDLAVPMREYNAPLLDGNTRRLVRDRAELLAGWCGLDPEAVWQWGYIERVSTGLTNLRDFDNPDNGRLFLEVATRSL
ncbi:MAG: hypothetical protein GY925_07690 [Actinomycetia bacterium]|nr:hypothetical protein [Actinomycetes bacterium]